MKKTIKIFFLIVFIWMALSTFSIVNAASAKIEAKPATVYVGEKSTVTVTVDAATCNLTVSGSASDKIVEVNLKGENEKYTKTYTIDTSKAGTYTVSLKGDITDGPTDLNTKIDESVSITVKVKETKPEEKPPVEPEKPSTPETPTEEPTEQPKTKSTNAYLSTLGVTPKEYDFSGFKKTNLTYNVTVPYEVDSLKVLYKTADDGAKVKVSGNSGFDVGSNNKITVKVTAEDEKTTKTYTIKVTKLAEEIEKPGNVIEEPKEELFLTSLSIKGIDISPEFSKDTYAYTATLSKNDVTEVEVKAEANIEDAVIEVSGNTNLVVGENTINIVVKQEGSTQQTVYQINLTKEAALVTTGENTDFMSSLIDNVKNYIIIAVLVVVLIIAAIVILIVLLRKENKKLKNEEAMEEYNVYENDEKEFEDNKVEEVVIKEEANEATNETETKNEGRKTRRKEKGRHSK